MNKSDDLNVIIGQIEDELRGVVTAKQMLDDAAQGNAELTRALEKLLASSAKLEKLSESTARDVIASIDDKVAAINGCTTDFEALAKESHKSIVEQAAKATQAFEYTVGSLSKEAVDSIEQSALARQSAFSASQEALQNAAREIEDMHERSSEEQTKQAGKIELFAEQTQRKLDEVNEAIDELRKIDSSRLMQDVDDIHRELKAQGESIAALERQILGLEDGIKRLETLFAADGAITGMLEKLDKNTQKKGLFG